jgi:hypothetical protein
LGKITPLISRGKKKRLKGGCGPRILFHVVLLTPLAVRALPVAGGSELFVILGTPHTISGAILEQSSLRLSDGINNRVSGINTRIPFIALFEQERQCPSLSLPS